MNKSIFVTVVAALTVSVAWVGCSSSGGTKNPSTSSTSTSSGTGGVGSSTSSSGAGGSGAGGSSGAGGTPDGGAGIFSCNTLDAAAPSGGSCITVVAVNDAGNDAGTGIQCNPVTNAPCATGDECDYATDANNNIIGWVCYPPPNTATVCQSCDQPLGPDCVGGTTCFGTDSTGTTAACAQYCCTDADCGGSGKCTTSQGGPSFFGPLAPFLGVCLAM